MKLSSHTTFFWKFIFPGIWIYSFLYSLSQIVWRAIMFGDPIFELRNLFGFVFWGFVSVITVWFLGSLKSVYLEGDSLLVANYYRKIRLPLTEIAAVNGPDGTSHRRISLSLNTHTIFGDEIWFMPPLFAARSTADLLRKRIESLENDQKELASKMPEDAGIQ